MAGAFEAQNAESLKHKHSYLEFLTNLVDGELESRDNKGLHKRIKSARFPNAKTLEEFSFDFQPKLDVKLIKTLASCDFVERKQNVILVGQPGTGKTHLSIALGIKACERGFDVRFDRVPAMGHEGRLVEKFAADVVRIAAKAKSESEANAMIDEIESQVRERLGDVVFGVDEDRLEEVTLDLIAKHGWTLTAIESDLNGLLARKIPHTVSFSNLTADSLSFVNYNNKGDMEKLVLRERQRELLFEGKRWFDLMRLVRRNKDATAMLAYISPKLTGDNMQIKKMSIMNGLYFPILKNELEINPNLVQNPFYENSDFLK